MLDDEARPPIRYTQAMSPPRPDQRALIEEELARLCASEALRRAPSHLRLLRYLVEKGVSGNTSAFREAAIAFEVFHRDPAVYDPQSDPIVRVTVGRLRARLEAHYARCETPPKLRIVLPKGGYAPQFMAPKTVTTPAQGLAVLEVRNDTARAELEPLCQSLGVRLADGLARLGVPRVIARESVASAQAQTKDPRAIGAMLGVEWVLDTRLDGEGGQALRATARLLSATDGGVRWIETRAAPDADRLALVDALADRVYHRFSATLKGDAGGPDPEELSGLAVEERHTLDLARMFCARRAVSELEEMTPELEAITRRHPQCATSWGVLAAAIYTQTLRMDRESAPLYAAARGAALHAASLDPDESSAASVLGALLSTHDVNPSAAMGHFRAVLRRAPHHSLARQNLAALLCYTGSFDEALAEARIARRYDPLSILLRISHAAMLAYARRHDESRREWRLLEMAGALGESGTPAWLGATFAGNNELWDGQFDRAAEHYRHALAAQPDNPAPPMCLGMVEARRGNRAAAVAQEAHCRERFPKMSSYQLAMLAGALRDKPRVLRELHRAHERKDPLLVSACVDPSFDWLADDPDFNGLLRSWSLPGWRGGEYRRSGEVRGS